MMTGSPNFIIKAMEFLQSLIPAYIRRLKPLPPEDTPVTLWTEDKTVSRPVPLSLVNRLPGDLKVPPGLSIYTKCRTIAVLDQLILHLQHKPLSGGFRCTIDLLDVANSYGILKLSHLCMRRLDNWKNSYETVFHTDSLIEFAGYKLASWLSSSEFGGSSISDLQSRADSSGRSSFEIYMDFKNLRKLLLLGYGDPYDDYRERYSGIEFLRSMTSGVKMSQLENEFTTEVLLSEEDLRSGFVILIAMDGFAIKVQKTILISQSGCFRGMFEVFEDRKEILCRYCKDRFIMNCWVDFMTNANFNESFQVLRGIEKERVLIDLLHVADYYIVDGMVLLALKLLNLTVKDRNALAIYNNLAMNYTTNEEGNLGKYLKRKIEMDFTLEIYDSSKFLSLDPIELVLIASVVEEMDILYTVLEAYTYCNGDALYESFEMPDKGTLAKRLKQFKIFTPQEEIIKINLNEFNFNRVLKCLRLLNDQTGRRYLGLEALVQGFVNIHLADIAKISENPTVIVLFRTERCRDDQLEANLTFQIYKEKRKYDQYSINIRDFDGFFSGLEACIQGRKIIVWNFNYSKLVYQGTVKDMDTEEEISLPTLEGNYNIIYFAGRLLAINNMSSLNLIFNEIDSKWAELDLPSIFPLIGNPLVVGDRLFILPPEDDWIRFLRPFHGQKEESDYDFVQDFVAPPSVGEEPLDSPNRFLKLRDGVDNLLAAHEHRGRIYLIGQTDVLIYENSNLMFIDQRDLPPIPEDNGWFQIMKAISVSGQLLILGRDDDFLEVYAFDIDNWSLHRILRDEYNNHGHLVRTAFGFLKYNQQTLATNFKASYIQIP